MLSSWVDAVIFPQKCKRIFVIFPVTSHVSNHAFELIPVYRKRESLMVVIPPHLFEQFLEIHEYFRRFSHGYIIEIAAFGEVSEEMRRGAIAVSRRLLESTKPIIFLMSLHENSLFEAQRTQVLKQDERVLLFTLPSRARESLEEAINRLEEFSRLKSAE